MQCYALRLSGQRVCTLSMIESGAITAAEIELPSSDLHADLAFFTDTLGFRLQTIHPSDDPAVAVLSGYGLRVRLDRFSALAPGTIHLELEPDSPLPSRLVSPGGSAIVCRAGVEKAVIPPPLYRFQTRRLADSDAWVVGRAGMLYRDLIDDRLGGSIIASHIRIPDGGPVPDMVHYHTIGFQLIFCLSGWVRLVYEDQGPPFVLNAGDCVTQPPKIRHRVLESSDNLEVLEIGVPAENLTTIDHALELPTPTFKPQRQFDGQVFCHSRVTDAQWAPSRLPGFEFRETGIALSTAGMASVVVHRPAGQSRDSTAAMTSHDGGILFSFISRGRLQLEINDAGDAATHQLHVGDAFVIPPGLCTKIDRYSNDLQVIEVSLPGAFNTQLHADE